MTNPAIGDARLAQDDHGWKLEVFDGYKWIHAGYTEALANAKLIALEKERDELRHADSERTYTQLLNLRGIFHKDDACEKCGGLGNYTYGSTSTWRGGIGGRAMTSGPCDKCWGSGDKHRAWMSHRKVDAMVKERDAAVTSLHKLAEEVLVMRAAVLEVAAEMALLSGANFHAAPDAVQGWADALREAVGA